MYVKATIYPKKSRNIRYIFGGNKYLNEPELKKVQQEKKPIVPFLSVALSSQACPPPPKCRLSLLESTTPLETASL